MMDAAVFVQATILVRAAIDAGKAMMDWLSGRKPARDVIPVYSLVTRQHLLMARSNLAADITKMRWPR